MYLLFIKKEIKKEVPQLTRETVIRKLLKTEILISDIQAKIL